MEKLLLTRRETADALGCCVEKLDALRKAGGGPPHVRFGSSIRYYTEALKLWCLRPSKN